MNPEKFLDTSYAIALSSSTDDYHHKALAIAQQLKTSKTPLVTTRAIILEIGNALSKQKYRSKSITLLSSLEKDRTVTVIPLSEILYQKAFQLYCQRNDKNWGIVDCISFIVMEERRITGLFWFLCGNEVYTDSLFNKIVLKVFPSKHFTIS